MADGRWPTPTPRPMADADTEADGRRRHRGRWPTPTPRPMADADTEAEGRRQFTPRRRRASQSAIGIGVGVRGRPSASGVGVGVGHRHRGSASESAIGIGVGVGVGHRHRGRHRDRPSASAVGVARLREGRVARRFCLPALARKNRASASQISSGLSIGAVTVLSLGGACKQNRPTTRPAFRFSNSRSTPSRLFGPRSRGSGTATAISANRSGGRSARSRSTSRKATAAKAGIVSRASRPQRAPTPRRVQRCGWRSRGAMSPRSRSNRATSFSIESRRCSTVLARGGDGAPPILSLQSRNASLAKREQTATCPCLVKRRSPIAYVLAQLLCARGMWSTSAAADGESEPVRFEYVAAAGCPSEGDFLRAVQAHSSRARAARDSEPARTFRVRLEAGAGSGAQATTGTLVVLEEGRAPVPRTVEARTCAEAMEALAFIAALSLDPRAEADTAAGRPAATAPPPAPDAAAPPIAPVPEAAPPQPPPVTPGPAERRLADAGRTAATRTPSTPHAAGHSEWAVGAGAQAVGLAAPGALAALEVSVAWRWRSTRFFSPQVRLSALRTQDATVDALDTRTSLSWTFGRLELSPGQLGTRIAVEAAPFVDAGVVTAGGGGPPQTFPSVRPWVAIGALARGALRPVRWISLEIEGGALLPLVRDTFYYSPAPTAYQAPAVAAFGGIGAAVHFP